MPVPDDKLGPYIQVAHRLRFTKDAPPRHDRVSARPRKGDERSGWGAFLDDPERDPTLVTFEPDDAVDVDALLRQGAIRLVTAPKREPKRESKPKPKREPKPAKPPKAEAAKAEAPQEPEKAEAD